MNEQGVDKMNDTDRQCIQAADERVFDPMIKSIDDANVEYALRLLMSKRSGELYQVALEGRNSELEGCERRYNTACDTYQRVTGKSPFAATK